MSKYKANLLVVEDDENLGFILKDYLEMLGYHVVLEKDGIRGFDTFNLTPNEFNLCILDVMLPFKDGFTLADEIRKINPYIAIVFLTAKVLKEDKIRGFKIGADDYISKPFSSEELGLRIEAILRRYHQDSKANTFQLGSFAFDYTNQLLTSPLQVIHLTKKESEVLRLLCLNQNQLVRREVALKAIWGEDDYFMGRSMDVYITRLRKYFKDEEAVTITNIHGTGFKLETRE